MKRLFSIIGAGAAIAVVGFAVSYRVGYRRGVSSGLQEGEALVTHVQLAQKTAALELIRAGDTNKGVAYLDHTLDRDVLAIEHGRLSLPSDSQARSNSLCFLQRVASYRAQYPRLPYVAVIGDREIPKHADEVLREVGK